MKIETFRMNGKPVSKSDKELFSKEFTSFFDDYMLYSPPSTESEWSVLNEELNALEQSLKSKYPSVKELSLTYIKDVEQFVRDNGSVSFFIDTDNKLKMVLNEE